MAAFGIPKELKADEARVALTAAAVTDLTGAGHAVAVETGAGLGSRVPDSAYEEAGAEIVPDAETLFERCEVIVKVKEPLAREIIHLNSRHTLFCYLHLAPNRDLTDALLDSGATCIAFEEVEDEQCRLPLLTPMSEIAGRIASHAGAATLQRPGGGPGLLMGGVPGVPSAQVTIIGGGVVGSNAASVALGMGADVCILDRSLPRLRELDALFDGRADLRYSSALEIERALSRSDLVIGAVLLRGARAPRLVSEEQLGAMKEGAVLVDVAIDQGGCFETSRATTHSEPTFEVDGVIHYCVANMPGAVPITSTTALSNALLPYVATLGVKPPREACLLEPGLRHGASIVAGTLTSEPVARSQGRDWVTPEVALGATVSGG